MIPPAARVDALALALLAAAYALTALPRVRGLAGVTPVLAARALAWLTVWHALGFALRLAGRA